MNAKTHFCVHGASSLIGRNFCLYLLSKGYSFTVCARESSNVDFLMDTENVSIYRYERSLSELFGKVAQMEGAVFVHLAWAGVFGVQRDAPGQATFNVPEMTASIELSKKIGAKHWIGFGSQAEYGNINVREAIDESFPCNPITLYGKAKLECSRTSAQLCKAYGMEHSWLRLFSTYGPYGNHQWFVDYLIEEMKGDRVINVTKCEQYLDYLYVDDISRALIALGEGEGVGVANLGSGKAVQLKTVVEAIHTILKSRSTINYGALPYRPNESMFQEANISKLSRAIDWKPEVSITEGLKDMIKKSQTQ